MSSEPRDLDGLAFCPSGFAQRFHAIGECDCPIVLHDEPLMDEAGLTTILLRMDEEAKTRLIDWRDLSAGEIAAEVFRFAEDPT